MMFALDVIGIIFYFISFHLFIPLYPDFMGSYVLRLYDVINLLCLADGIAKTYSYCVNVTHAVVTGLRCY